MDERTENTLRAIAVLTAGLEDRDFGVDIVGGYIATSEESVDIVATISLLSGTMNVAALLLARLARATGLSALELLQETAATVEHFREE